MARTPRTAREGSTAKPLNATAAALLGFLHAGPMSGWDIVERAERTIANYWTLTRSQVYRELGGLAESGLVVEGERGSRARRPYTITDAGRAAFRVWLETAPGPEQIRYPLLLTMGFGAHLPPGKLAEFVADHRATHEERLAHYRSVREALEEGAVDPYTLATLDFGIRYETAVLDWIAHLPPEIREC